MATAALFLLMLAAGCQMKADVSVKVRPDGSGTVTVAVRLDKEAVAKVPDFAAGLRLDGLKAAGWTQDGPKATADGGQVVTLSHVVGKAADFANVLSQLTGTQGGLSNAKVVRSHSFGSTSYTFSGDLDLSQGTGTFTDPAFTKLLGGQSVDQLLGGAPATAGNGSLTVRVSLPGTKADKEWTAALGAASQHLSTSSKQSDSSAMLFVLVAVAAALGAAGTGFLVRLAIRR